MAEKKIGIVCRMTAEHLTAVAALERLCFAEPWSEKSLAMLTAPGGVGFVALSATGELCGYAGMLTVLDEGQITDVAVLPEYRRCGIGGALIAEILQFARQAALAEITLEVRVSNEAAIALYRRAGFFVCGERKNFYRMPVENAYLMKYTFPTDRENLQGV